MSVHKYVLVVGDDENAIFAFDKRLGYIEDTVLNFSHSPSIAVTFCSFDDEIRILQEEARLKGLKVGIYATLDKAKGFAEKVVGITDSAELRERSEV